MSGHSKWSQIKRQKGAADAKRGNLFSKLANAISIAARDGTDPATNFQLKIAVERAKAANVPKENIERAIDRVKGADTATLEEVTFEAYGQGGVAFLIETATDNRNRTAAAVRSVINKYNGKMAETGSVSYLFEKKGLITVKNQGNTQEVGLLAIDLGAQDVENDNQWIYIYTDPHELIAIKEKLAAKNHPIEEFGLIWEAKNPIIVNDNQVASRLIKMSEELDELDDVTRVSSNFETIE